MMPIWAYHCFYRTKKGESVSLVDALKADFKDIDLGRMAQMYGRHAVDHDVILLCLSAGCSPQELERTARRLRSRLNATSNTTD
jgi:hypothetical protein